MSSNGVLYRILYAWEPLTATSKQHLGPIISSTINSIVAKYDAIVDHLGKGFAKGDGA
jgi:hypothetical protein